MTQFVIANNVNTQLAAAASSGATALTLASSANLPTLSAGQIMPLTLNDAATGQNYEIVYVTAISGVTLTVTRAQEGTGALNWSIGDYAYCAPTAGTVAMTSGNPNDTFQVAASTALTHAPQTGQVQRSAFNYAGLAGGTANAITATLSPAPTSYTDYLLVTVRIAAANTGSVSLNVNGLGVVPVIGQGHQTLQGGELFAGGFATFAYSTNYSEAILLECTGGALQIAPATQSQHAVQFAQISGVVGSSRNLKMNITAPSVSATLTADEIIVESALGGLRYCLGSFNKTINLAITGAGGMDTGSAPISGYVALYAIYNPTTQTAALLATNATSVIVNNVYGGGTMPSGYTASALVSVWQTNGSGQLIVGTQRDRKIWIAPSNIVNTASLVGVWTSVSVSAVPPNATKCGGYFLVNAASGTGTLTISLAASSSAVGQKSISAYVTSANASIASFDDVPLAVAQTLYYQTATNGTATSLSFVVAICSYEI